MDNLTRQRLRQQIELLKAHLDEMDCERIMIEKEIERIKQEIGE